MCRILAVTGKRSPEENKEALLSFRPLADCGCVPPGSPRGHRDGWGAAAYRRGKVVFYTRSMKDAFADPLYPKAVAVLTAKQPDVFIMHFRKASVGARVAENVHPFVSGQYAFCHNGSLFESKKLPLSSRARRALKGTTDSERFFQYVLDRIEMSLRAPKGRGNLDASTEVIRKAFLGAVRFARRVSDYTAMIMFFSDGKRLWVLREVNEKNKFVREKKLLKNYYTLYRGTSSGEKKNRFFASEPVLEGVQWKLIQNHELIELDIRIAGVKSYRV